MKSQKVVHKKIAVHVYVSREMDFLTLSSVGPIQDKLLAGFVKPPHFNVDTNIILQLTVTVRLDDLSVGD